MGKRKKLYEDMYFVDSQNREIPVASLIQFPVPVKDSGVDELLNRDCSEFFISQDSQEPNPKLLTRCETAILDLEMLDEANPDEFLQQQRLYDSGDKRCCINMKMQ